MNKKVLVTILSAIIVLTGAGSCGTPSPASTQAPVSAAADITDETHDTGSAGTSVSFAEPDMFPEITELTEEEFRELSHNIYLANSKDALLKRHSLVLLIQ